jgi:hypothetical protein
MFRQDHTKWTKLVVGILLLIAGIIAAFSGSLTLRGIQLATGSQAMIAGGLFSLVGVGVLIYTWRTEF